MNESQYNAKTHSSLIYLHKNKLWVNPSHIVTITPRTQFINGKLLEHTDSWTVNLSDDDCCFHVGDDDMETLGIFLELEDA
tara:strand:+ start:831 stop:1073 length:243 start_codon:yes stop_codon:yes gene_type:complete